MYNLFSFWAINSIGRVPPLHGGSYKFESCIAHHLTQYLKDFQAVISLDSIDKTLYIPLKIRTENVQNAILGTWHGQKVPLSLGKSTIKEQ